MLIWFLVGSIVYMFVLFFLYAIFAVGSKADEYAQAMYRDTVYTQIVEESAIECGKRIVPVREKLSIRRNLIKVR